MNGIRKESLAAGRNIAVGSNNQRGRSLTGNGRVTDENLDLFSRNQRSLSIALSDDMDQIISMKLARLSVGLAKPARRSGLDDLLSSVDGEKHDYDWLLTPPGTPHFSSSDANVPQPTLAAPRIKTRSASTTKASRLSAAQSDNSYSSRSIRSSSVTRPSISTVRNNTHSSNSTRSSSILNTSSASVTSSPRPSTPTTRATCSPRLPTPTARSPFPSTARPSITSTRPVPLRSSTPMKSRPIPTTNSSDKIRVTQSSRPLGPSAKPQSPGNLNSPAVRSSSRPSTPTHRVPGSTATRSASAGRVLSNGRNSVPVSRGSSPGPRARAPQQPIVPPGFPLDTPPNLRTTLPNRSVSAGRSRPGAAVTVRGNLEAPIPVTPPRRQSSPAVSRGRLAQSPGRGRLHANGDFSAAESQKIPPVSEMALRRHANPATGTESSGFGRTISKKSLDMAVRHMDIRHGTGSIRSVPGTTLFPQSIRGPPKGQPSRALVAPDSIKSNIKNGAISESERRSRNGRPLGGETKQDNGFRLSAKNSEPDIHDDSSRYDAILLKEDFNNTNWLHDSSDQGLIFDDHRFDQLPEPFGLL